MASRVTAPGGGVFSAALRAGWHGAAGLGAFDDETGGGLESAPLGANREILHWDCCFHINPSQSYVGCVSELQFKYTQFNFSMQEKNEV